jgi:hypothetical protein
MKAFCLERLSELDQAIEFYDKGKTTSSALFYHL